MVAGTFYVTGAGKGKAYLDIPLVFKKGRNSSADPLVNVSLGKIYASFASEKSRMRFFVWTTFFIFEKGISTEPVDDIYRIISFVTMILTLMSFPPHISLSRFTIGITALKYDKN